MTKPLRVLTAVGALLAAFPISASAENTDYAGWAYTSAYGDFPLHFHADLDAKALSLTYDSPAAKGYDLAVAKLVRSGDKITFERDVGDPEPWRFEAILTGERLTGVLFLGTVRIGDFDTRKTALPLARIRPDRYADCAGTYRADSGATLLVTSWQWGELRMVDLASGAERTLFPSDDDQFFVGPAQYVPAPLEAKISFVRNADEDIVALDRIGAAGTVRYAFTPRRTEDVSWQSDDATLFGTLSFPAGDPPYPAMIVLGGSNWTTRATVNRDAAVFAAQGLLVLTYDQRGFGASTGKIVCSFEQTAADARAAAAMLAARKDVDKARIGVTGASRGGWTAPLAASKCQQIAFVIIRVPPSISPAEQEHTRRLNLFRSTPRSKEDIELATQYVDAAVVRTTSDEAWARYKKRYEEVEKHEGWIDILLAGDEKDSEGYVWEHLNFQYDPVPTLEQVHCPILALFGERDDNVVPAENVPKMKAAFEKAGNRDATIVIVPTANHGLNPVPEKGPPLPIHEFTGACPEVYATITSWLGSHGIVKSTPTRRP